MPIPSEQTWRRVMAAVAKVEALRFTGNVQTHGSAIFIPPTKTPATITQPGPEYLEPCIVQWSGSGTAGGATTPPTLTYFLFSPYDTGFSNSWSGTNALTPMNSAARIFGNCQITVAPDGSDATAFRDTDGSWVLWDCEETVSTYLCGT